MDAVRHRLRAFGCEEIGVQDEERDHLALLLGHDERLVIGDPEVFSAEPDDRAHRACRSLDLAVWLTILTVGQLVYVVVLAGWILLEKRSPVATLAWILALIALPYVGFAVFFFLGPRRLKRKRLKHKRARGAVRPSLPMIDHADPATGADPRAHEISRLAVKAGEPPADRCDHVRIFHAPSEAYAAMLAEIDKAKHHVHLQSYILDPRRSGERVRESLIAAAKRGVRVRLLVDDVGSSAMGRKYVKPLRDAGVMVGRFNRVAFSRIRSRFDFRNHRKILVCDGCIGFTGGLNVSDEYLPLPEGHPRPEDYAPWLDTHVRLEGDAVRWLQLTFLDDWFYTTGYVGRDSEYFPPRLSTGNNLVQIVASGPDRETEPIQKTYFAAITTSRERVYVTTPYFVPDDAILTALVTAGLRGVDVRVLVPRVSDSIIVTAAARSYYDTLLAAGVRIYEYQPTMIHSKTLLVDDYFAAVGTANMDNRSFRLNFEITALLFGQEHATTLAEIFRRDMKDSIEVREAARSKLSVKWRLAEAGARILSPLL